MNVITVIIISCAIQAVNFLKTAQYKHTLCCEENVVNVTKKKNCNAVSHHWCVPDVSFVLDLFALISWCDMICWLWYMILLIINLVLIFKVCHMIWICCDYFRHIIVYAIEFLFFTLLTALLILSAALDEWLSHTCHYVCLWCLLLYCGPSVYPMGCFQAVFPQVFLVSLPICLMTLAITVPFFLNFSFIVNVLLYWKFFKRLSINALCLHSCNANKTSRLWVS